MSTEDTDDTAPATPKSKKKGISLAQLNAVAASDQGVEFEYTFNGQPTGIWFKVLGAHAQKVQDESNRLINDRRRREIERESAIAQGKVMNGAINVPRVEDDIEFGRRLAVARLVGWRCVGDTEGLTPEQKERFEGLVEPYTPENAAALVGSNADISSQIIAKSNELGAFMTALSPVS